MSKEQKTNKGRQPLVELGGRSYEEIARACGSRKSVVHRWLTGQAMPRPTKVQSLAKSLGLKTSALLAALYRGRAA